MGKKGWADRHISTNGIGKLTLSEALGGSAQLPQQRLSVNE